LIDRIEESELFAFARTAHEERFPSYAWKAIACDTLGLPMGTRPTMAQMINQPHHWSDMWLQLTLRFDQMNTVRWTEHLECEEERIHNALRHLGSTPDQVAERLSMMGVMGDTMESCDCPLAHFFTGMYGAWFVKVFRADVHVDFATCANPLAVENMVHAFDNGHLPKLDLFPDRTPVL
jgi:hypothetical protein